MCFVMKIDVYDIIYLLKRDKNLTLCWSKSWYKKNSCCCYYLFITEVKTAYNRPRSDCKHLGAKPLFTVSEKIIHFTKKNIFLLCSFNSYFINTLSYFGN